MTDGSLEEEFRGAAQRRHTHAHMQAGTHVRTHERTDRRTDESTDSFESNYKSVERPSHTERCRSSVPTCFLPSQHGGEDAGTLAQVGVCFSQLVEGDKRETDRLF